MSPIWIELVLGTTDVVTTAQGIVINKLMTCAVQTFGNTQKSSRTRTNHSSDDANTNLGRLKLE